MTLEGWVEAFVDQVARVAPACRARHLVRVAASRLHVDLGASDPSEVAPRWMVLRCRLPRDFLVGRSLQP